MTTRGASTHEEGAGDPEVTTTDRPNRAMDSTARSIRAGGDKSARLRRSERLYLEQRPTLGVIKANRGGLLTHVVNPEEQLHKRIVVPR